MSGSRLWLIPAALLVTAALAAIGTWWSAGAIESVLTSRSQAALAGAGLSGGQVSFDGRDAKLRGFPADKAQRAAATVRGIDGVRVATVEAADTADTAPAPATGSAAPSTGQVIPSPTLTTSPPPTDNAGLQAEINRMLAIGPITFEPGSAQLTRAGERAALQVAALIAGSPVTAGIQVDGHAARVSDGSQSAFELSRRRTATVVDLLVKNGVAAARISSRAYGDTRPRSDGKDRRVDITVR